MTNLNLPLYPKHQPSAHKSQASQYSYAYSPILLQIIMPCNVNRLDTMKDSFATTFSYSFPGPGFQSNKWDRIFSYEERDSLPVAGPRRR